MNRRKTEDGKEDEVKGGEEEKGGRKMNEGRKKRSGGKKTLPGGNLRSSPFPSTSTYHYIIIS